MNECHSDFLPRVIDRIRQDEFLQWAVSPDEKDAPLYVQPKDGDDDDDDGNPDADRDVVPPIAQDADSEALDQDHDIMGVLNFDDD